MKNIIYSTTLVLSSTIALGQSITDGLLLHYRLNGDAVDQSSNGFNGVASGATPVVDMDGNPNSAYFFDGVDDYIDLPDEPALKPDIPFSFSYMVKFDHLNLVGSQMFTSDFEENNYHGSWTTLSADGTGRVTLSFGGGLGNTGSDNRRTKLSDVTVVTQKWYRLTFVVHGATDMDIYIDCVDAGGTYAGTGPTEVAYSNVPGSLGRKDAHTSLPPYYFEGTLDDSAFWNRALSQSEVVSLCAGILDVGDRLPAKQIVSVYPNPFQDRVNFKFSNPEKEAHFLKLFDASGREIRKTLSVRSELIELKRMI